MTNPGDCLQDGYTTGEGPGIGLGIIRRQSDRFDVFSAAGTGTVVVATVYDRPVDDTIPPIWDSPAPPAALPAWNGRGQQGPCGRAGLRGKDTAWGGKRGGQ